MYTRDVFPAIAGGDEGGKVSQTKQYIIEYISKCRWMKTAGTRRCNPQSKFVLICQRGKKNKWRTSGGPVVCAWKES